jgi:cytochrome c-type biogenesis protein CcmF
VENASFMPWLVGTALMHSLMVTEKRGAFRSWTVLLAIAAFSLSLLGTFLVRSGVLTSVHAFASDPRRGIFILLLLVLVVGSSLALFAWRGPKIARGGTFTLVSRESAMLAGNLFLLVAAASVLLGTLYPLIIDALNLGKLSVGPPYFNAVFVPVMVPAILLMVLAPFARWKQAEAREIGKPLRVVAIVAVLAGALVPLAMGGWTPLTALGIALAVAVAGSVVKHVALRLRAGRPPLAWWAMQLGHMGIAIFIVGITMVGGWQQEKDVRMEPGDTVVVGGYTFKFNGATQVRGPNYTAMRGDFELSSGTRVIRNLRPEKRTYFSSSMPMTDAAIDAGLTRDVYVSMGEPLDGGAWAVRVYYKPFVDWIWAGCFVMALGGIAALAGRRRRVADTAAQAEALAGSAA